MVLEGFQHLHGAKTPPVEGKPYKFRADVFDEARDKCATAAGEMGRAVRSPTRCSAAADKKKGWHRAQASAGSRHDACCRHAAEIRKGGNPKGTQALL